MTSPAPSPTIGLDIGGTKILGAVVDATGAVLVEHRVASPRGLRAFDEAVTEVTTTLRAEHDVAAIGVGIAGLVSREGVLRYGPNLPGAVELPVRDMIAEVTGLPVIVDNDANVAGYGEVAHGAAKGARNALMVTLGTGVGGAIITDGAIYSGAHGFAGEIGHFTVDREGPMCACGERGHWEAIASGSALDRMASERLGAGTDGAAAADAAKSGDTEALALFDAFAENVALGLVALANILDPELAVISGGHVDLGPLLFDPLRAWFAGHLEGAAHRPEVVILPAQLGVRAGVIGAAALARSLVT